ncbi:MAG: hypothetical protein LBR56_00375, partial [Sporomusaceae bacterium]|nr:hypothetical protein [Sporomusaceae bacterium]
LELLIVISILGLLAAAALPGAASNRHDLETAAQNLVSDIRLTQQLNLNSGGQKKYILYFLLPKKGAHYYLISGGDGEIKRVYLPESVIIRSQPNPVSFSVGGVPISGGNTTMTAQTITLENTGGLNIFIRLAPITGRARSTYNNDPKSLD